MELKKHQPPMTVEEQIENLKNLGLIMDNEDEVKDFLNDISYFRLIKGFSIGLKKRNDIYNEGVTFDEIKELYLFNANFRQVIFAQVEKVEINLRCRISNYFSCKYGDNRKQISKVLSEKDAAPSNTKEADSKFSIATSLLQHL